MSTIILPVSGNGGPVTVAPFLTVGGRVFSDLTNLIVLYAQVGDGKFSVFGAQGAGGGRAVTTGKTFTLSAFRVYYSVAAAANVFTASIGYCDTDIGLNSNGPIVNSVNLYGDTADNSGQILGSVLPENNVIDVPTLFTIPAGKFIYVVNSISGQSLNIMLFGYEA
jgi:hypothetical protein